MKTIEKEFTYQEVISMYHTLNNIKQQPLEIIKEFDDKDDYVFHLRFIKGVNANKKSLKEHFEDVEKLEKPSDEYVEYAKERNDLLAEMAKKDEDGNPIQNKRFDKDGNMISASYNVPGLGDPKSSNAKKLKAFDDKNKELIDLNKEREKQLTDILKDKVSVKLTLISESLVPKGLSPQEMDVSCEFVDWDEEEEEVEEKKEKKPAKK